MLVRDRDALQTMWSQLRSALESKNGVRYFTIFINYEDAGQLKTYRMKMTAIVTRNQITEVYNSYDKTIPNYSEVPCISIEFNQLVSSSIQRTNYCTDPPLPRTGTRDFLTEIKLQLMFGLSDLKTAKHSRVFPENKMVDIFNVAHIGQSMLTPYKLVRDGTMTYSKYGFRPINWTGEEYDIFINKLKTITLNELDDDLQNKIKKLSRGNSSLLVRDAMKKISLDRDNDNGESISEKVLEEVLQNLIDDEEVDSDLAIDDPNENEYSIYYQFTTEDKQYDNDNKLKHKYVVVGYEIDSENTTNTNRNRNNIQLEPLYNLNSNNNIFSSNTRKRGRNNNNNNNNNNNKSKKPRTSGGTKRRRQRQRRKV
jgi:hypothetical protein